MLSRMRISWGASMLEFFYWQISISNVRIMCCAAADEFLLFEADRALMKLLR